MSNLLHATRSKREDSDYLLKTLQTHEALLTAIPLVNESLNATFRLLHSDNSIGERFSSSSETNQLIIWLEENGKDEKELEVLYWVSRHVVAEWEMIPKRTKKQHRLFERIDEQIGTLLKLIDQTGSQYYRGGGHGLRNACISELLTLQEEQQLLAPIRKLSEMNVEFDSASDLPKFEEVLRRFASAARRIAAEGPIHSQPAKRGARSGYFVRRMGEFLMHRYQKAPPFILSTIASITLNETIDEDLARKLLHGKERSGAKES